MSNFKEKINVLHKFASILPGKTYAKKLFFWNLIQFPVGTTIYFILIPFNANVVVAWLNVALTEFFNADVHIWGDFVWLFTGIDLRGILWVFVVFPLFLVITYLWAFRDNKIAKYVRSTSYLISLSAYLIWTIFFTWDARYDYAIWAMFIRAYDYMPLAFLMVAIAISCMWFGVIISNGYLIYKAWKEKEN